MNTDDIRIHHLLHSITWPTPTDNLAERIMNRTHPQECLLSSPGYIQNENIGYGVRFIMLGLVCAGLLGGYVFGTLSYPATRTDYLYTHTGAGITLYETLSYNG